MKNPLKICSVAVMLLLMLFGLYLAATKVSFGQYIAAAEGVSTSNGTTLSDEDWKIELNESTQSGSHEFDFIQKNLPSAESTDNGHILLISGIILAVLGVAGLVFFSFCLYKLCKNTKEHRKKSSAARYK